MYNNPYGKKIANQIEQNNYKWVKNTAETGQAVDYPDYIYSQSKSIGGASIVSAKKYMNYPQTVESYAPENKYNQPTQMQQRTLGRLYGSGAEPEKHRPLGSMGMSVKGSKDDLGYYAGQEKQYSTLGAVSQMKPKTTKKHMVQGVINPKALINLSPSMVGGKKKKKTKKEIEKEMNSFYDMEMSKGLEEAQKKLSGGRYFQEIEQPKAVNLKDLFKKMSGKGFPRSIGGATKKQIAEWESLIKTTI